MRTIVFGVVEAGALGGITTAVSNLGQAFAEQGWDVQQFALRDAPGFARGPSQWRPALVHPELSASASIRGSGLTAYQRLLGIRAFARKRLDRIQGRRETLRRLQDLPAGSILVATNVEVKIYWDSIGYRASDAGHVLIGQHHSTLKGAFATWEGDALVRAFRDIDLFVALSAEDAEEFSEVLDAPTVGIPNCYEGSRGQVCDRIPKRAVFIGRLAPEKNVTLLVELFAAAADPTWSLEIFGDGPCRDEIAARIAELGVQSMVTMRGLTRRPTEEFSAASVALMASDFEGFGMTIVEAGSVGTPTVSFDSGAGVRELLADGCGWVVPIGDNVAYVDALRVAMLDDQENRRRGERIRERTSLYAHSEIYRKWERAINAIA